MVQFRCTEAESHLKVAQHWTSKTRIEKAWFRGFSALTLLIQLFAVQQTLLIRHQLMSGMLKLGNIYVELWGPELNLLLYGNNRGDVSRWMWSAVFIFYFFFQATVLHLDSVLAMCLVLYMLYFIYILFWLMQSANGTYCGFNSFAETMADILATAFSTWAVSFCSSARDSMGLLNTLIKTVPEGRLIYVETNILASL